MLLLQIIIYRNHQLVIDNLILYKIQAAFQRFKRHIENMPCFLLFPANVALKNKKRFNASNNRISCSLTMIIVFIAIKIHINIGSTIIIRNDTTSHTVKKPILLLFLDVFSPQYLFAIIIVISVKKSLVRLRKAVLILMSLSKFILMSFFFLFLFG